MNSFMSDDFINKRVFNKLLKNVKEKELSRAIEELEYFNQVKKTLINRHQQNPIQTEFIKKVNDAKQRLQV